MNITTPDIHALRAIVANADDNAGHHLIWLSPSGNVHLTRLVDELPIEWEKRNEGRYKFRTPSFVQGNGYVGPEAAQDTEWMKDLLAQLINGWQMPRSGNYQD